MQPVNRNQVGLTVGRQEHGQTLQHFLAARLDVSRRYAKELLDARLVWVNRQCVWMAHHALHAGDVVEARTSVSPVATTHLRVLSETDRYLFVDKPAGIVSVGPGGAEERLREQLKDLELRCVHRLDRDTSGCLLVARDASAFDAAVSVFKTRRVIKVYEAIVAGRVTQAVSTIDLPLDGERARTHVKRLMYNDDATFVRVRIETGRTHQIRLHLAAVRHPVLGDREHGLKFARDPRLTRVPRQMLHALELELDDPTGRGRLRAHSPLPADFRRSLQIFGLGRTGRLRAPAAKRESRKR